MNNCTEILLNSAEYCEADENELSGIEAEILLWPGYTVQLSPTLVQPKITANKAPIKLPCIMQKSNVTITSRKGSFDSEIRVFIQNTAHNRGVINALRKCRFLAGIKEAGESVLQVFGAKKWETNQTMAKVKDDSVVIEFGKEFDSDKHIELVLSSVLDLPIPVIISQILPHMYNATAYITATQAIAKLTDEIFSPVAIINPGKPYTSTNFSQHLIGTGQFALRPYYQQTYVSAGNPTISVIIYPANVPYFYNDYIQVDPANSSKHQILANFTGQESFWIQYTINSLVVYKKLIILTIN